MNLLLLKGHGKYAVLQKCGLLTLTLIIILSQHLLWTASFPPLLGVSNSAQGAGMPLLQSPSHDGSAISWRTGRGCGCATVSTLPCGLRFNAALRVKTWR